VKRHSRSLRRILGGILALVVLLMPATKASAQDPDPVKPGTQWLGSCLQNANSVSVLVLLDRSGSLSQTDPKGVRYDGLKNLLGQLSRMKRTDGQSLAIEVAVSAFGFTYTDANSIVGWTKVNDDPARRQGIIDRILVKAKNGTAPTQTNTNYQAALDGAVRDLEDRAGPNNCRLLVWFTDGGFNDAAGGVDAARSAMCAPNGTLDAIRRLGILIIGLQLGADEGDLKSMTLGQSGARQCGTNPPGEGEPPGIYLNASDVGQLSSVFGQLSQILQGCTDAGTTGLIDPGIRRMIIASSISGPLSTVRVQPPDAPAFDAPAVGGSTHAGGYGTVGSSTDDQLFVEITFPAGKGTGQWAVGATQAVAVQYCVFADVALVPVPNQIVRAMPQTTFKVKAVDPAGDLAPMTDYSKATVAASVVGPDAKPRVATAALAPTGDITVTFDALTSDARVDYSLSLFLTTKSGLVLPPVKLSAGLALALSEDYPIVSPLDKLNLGRAIKRNPTQGEITLLGSAKGPTQVCFGAAVEVQVPSAAKGTTLDFQQGCVSLAPSEMTKVVVRVQPLAPAVGTGSAKIPVRLVPVATSGAPAAEAKLPVVWRFEDPTNPWVVGITAALTTLIALLLPLLALGLANWITAKYDVKTLRHAVIPVHVHGTTIKRDRDAAPAEGSDLITTLDLGRVPGLGRAPVRAFGVGRVTFKSKARFTPGFAPQFWVEPEAGAALVCSTSMPNDPADGSRASVPPGLGLVSILVCAVDDLRSGRDSIPGTLVVLTADGSLTGPHLEAKLAGLGVEDLRRHLKTESAQGRPSGSPASDDPFARSNTKNPDPPSDFPTS
jgi:hypothetical protein